MLRLIIFFARRAAGDLGSRGTWGSWVFGQAAWRAWGRGEMQSQIVGRYTVRYYDMHSMLGHFRVLLVGLPGVSPSHPGHRHRHALYPIRRDRHCQRCLWARGRYRPTGPVILSRDEGVCVGRAWCVCVVCVRVGVYSPGSEHHFGVPSPSPWPAPTPLPVPSSPLPRRCWIGLP